MLDVGIIRISPSLEHTPKAYFSINCCIESLFSTYKVNNKMPILLCVVEVSKNILCIIALEPL